MADENKLAELVAAKADISIDEVEKQLEQLTNRIQAASRDNPFRVDGLGTFMQEKNETHFEADDVLETEINQRYTGMKPIELMGSFKETGTGVAAQPAAADENFNPPEPKPKTSHTEEAKPAETKAQKKEQSKNAPKINETEKPAPADETGTGTVILIVVAIIVAILLTGWLLYDIGVF